MNIIDEIKTNEQIYKNQKYGENKYKSNYNLSKKTLISFNYFIEEVLKKYPNLQLIRIISLTKRECIPDYYGGTYNYEFEIKYAYINFNMLKNIMTKYGNIIFKYQDSYAINLYLSETIPDTEILTMCPIIINYVNHFDFHDVEKYVRLENLIKKITAENFPKEISLYSCNRFKKDSLVITRYPLIANNPFIEQQSLDNFCLEILKRLENETTSSIEKEMFIYQSIRNKLINNQSLNSDEFAILDAFLQQNEERIKEDNTMFQKSLSKKERQK